MVLRLGTRFRGHINLTELLTAIVDSSDDAIITTTAEGLIVGWSKGAEAVYGYSGEEVVSKPVSMLAPADRVHELDSIFGHLKNGHSIEHYETELLKNDGQRIEVSLRWRPLKNSKGQLVGAALVVRDISKSKQALAALGRAEVGFRAVFDNAAVGIGLVDNEGCCIQSNPVLQKMLGYSAQELSQISFKQFTFPEDLARELPLYQELLDGKRDHYRMEKRYIHKDGHLIWVRLTGSLARLPDGEPMFAVGIVEDITAQKASEDVARESQQRLSLVIAQTPLGVISWDTQFRVTDWNPAAAKIFGYTREEALGRHGSFLLPESAREFIDQLWKQLRDKAGGTQSTNENRTKDGRLIVCEWHNTLLVDGEDRLIGVASIVQDVTTQRDVEERLRQNQKMEAIGRLAGGVAHDFNNLLSVIIGHAAIAQESSTDCSIREHTEQIQKAGERAASLTRQLLAFSRKHVLEVEVLDLTELVETMSRMLARVIGEDIDMHIIKGHEPGFVRANRGQIEQVVMNLVVNARDAMPKGGHLTIRTTTIDIGAGEATKRSIPKGQYVQLTVTDTGHGMDSATVNHIFEPFFTTKDVGKGTGLGLATVHGIVAQSGGLISVDTKPGAGASFHILLPRVPKSASLEVDKAVKASALQGSGTILLAEDEASLRTLMRQILEGHGYTVLAASDGHSAIAEAEFFVGPIEMLITDVIMPGMRGYELAERVQKNRPNVKVLYISGYADTTLFDTQAYGQTGSMLEKPFTPETLLNKINEMLTDDGQ